MSDTKKFLLFFIVCYTSNVIDSIDSRPCKTSTGHRGTCKLVNKCTHYADLQKEKDYLFKKFGLSVKINFCEYNGYYPEICCPLTKVEGPGYESAMTKTSPNGQISKKKEPPSSKTKHDDENKIKKAQSLLPEKCRNKIHKRIIEGEAMRLDEFPWLALLEYKKFAETKLGCGGSLISKRYVLTAGHCVTSLPQNWRLESVRLGEYDTQSDPDCEPDGDVDLKCADRILQVPIEQKILHENFWEPKEYANDIALLRLAQNIPFTDYIQPICMNESPDDLGDNYVAAGWGQTEYKSQSTVKLKVSLPRFNFNECKKIYAHKGITLTEGQVCAGGKSEKDTCAGDSGGPLMSIDRGFWIIDGIVSMGHRPCGQRGVPTVYTKVFHYLPWILSKLKP